MHSGKDKTERCIVDNRPATEQSFWVLILTVHRTGTQDDQKSLFYTKREVPV